jgi:hypothetical protein
MPPGQRRELVFIDEEPTTIYEHNWKAGNSWKNWTTCLRGIEDSCPCCEVLGETNRYYVGYYTAVDTSKWTDRRGNEHQFELILIGAKIGTLKKLRRKRQDRLDDGATTALAGHLWRFTRDSDKDPAVGGDYEYVREVDLEKLFTLALYKGKKISEMFDKAEANSDSMKVLEKLFKIEKEGDTLVRKLVPINYYQQLHPLSVGDMRAAMNGVSPGGDQTEGARVDTSIPF